MLVISGLTIDSPAIVRALAHDAQADMGFVFGAFIGGEAAQTTPYSSMKALERMPVRSIRAPNMIGSTKLPRSPSRPTVPQTVPMLVGKSSPMYLKTLALPKAQVMPRMIISAAKR